MIRLVVFALLLTGLSNAQTINAQQSCWFPTPTVTTPLYFRLTATNPFYQCEQVTLDSTVLTVRSASNNLIVSSLSGSTAPNHVYTTVLQWPLVQSNTTYTDLPGTTTPTPFAGQPLWCSSTSIVGLQTFVPQLNQLIPTALVEVRLRVNPASGEIPQVLTTGGVLNASSPTSGNRFLWIKSSNPCNGNPAIVWTATAATIGIDANSVQTTLASVFIVGVL